MGISCFISKEISNISSKAKTSCPSWLNDKLSKLDYTPNTRTIYCEETKEIFKTQSDAAKKYNLNLVYISYYISKGEAYNGYTFKKVLSNIDS